MDVGELSLVDLILGGADVFEVGWGLVPSRGGSASGRGAMFQLDAGSGEGRGHEVGNASLLSWKRGVGRGDGFPDGEGESYGRGDGNGNSEPERTYRAPRAEYEWTWGN